MATKRKTTKTKSKRLKRGQAIRVPGAGTVTIARDGAVIFRGVPQKPNPTRRRKPTTRKRKTAARKRPVVRKRPVARKRPAKRSTSRRARR